MKTLLLALLLANATDAGLTIRNRNRFASEVYENNPLTRSIFNAGPKAIGFSVAGGTVLEIVGLHKLGKHHARMARILGGAALGGEAWGISTSITGHQK